MKAEEKEGNKIKKSSPNNSGLWAQYACGYNCSNTVCGIVHAIGQIKCKGDRDNEY